MKRIVFCFDGTWNKLQAPFPTNVVLIAESIFPTAEGVSQVIHYDDGVGTGGTDWKLKTWFDKLTGGILGWGLLDNIREAYRFLIFNYEPGDEIYVFGFSRGAYTARAFIGMLRCVSILAREQAGRIGDAVEHYRNRKPGDDASVEELRRFRANCAPQLVVSAEEDQWRAERVAHYVAGRMPRLTVRYAGLWDTVGALGLPASIPGAKRFNRRHQFYDTELPDFVEAGRHAVALDERRRTFPVTLWDNVEERNRARGADPADRKAPIQQQYFPGSHGSVGGGGDVRGLSDAALAWIVQGATWQGLKLDTRARSQIYTIRPNHKASLFNTKSGPDLMTRLFPKTDRAGPAQLHEVHASARRRWFEEPAAPTEGRYRPKSLDRVKDALDRLTEYRRNAYEGPRKAIHIVVKDDTLGSIAAHYYGKAALYTLIFEANRHIIDDPDYIYVDDELIIPPEPATPPQTPADTTTDRDGPAPP